MSRPENVSTGKMRLYDERGRAMLPTEVMDALGLDKGDEVKIIAEGDMAKMYKIDENGEIAP